MKTRKSLELSDVQKIIEAASAHARAKGWPVTICVTDDGGHLLGLARLDGAAPFTASMAVSKANTAALGRRESGIFEDAINKGRTALATAPFPGLLEGGVPILADGQCIGAVGVSGVKSAEDAETAKAGIAALS